jgi:hypothetical protein
MSTPAVAESSSSSSRLARVLPRFKELYGIYPNKIVFVHNSHDNNVLVYRPVRDATTPCKIRVEMFKVNLDKMPLRAEPVAGKLKSMFEMSVSCVDPTAKKPRYTFTTPIMPNNSIDAVLLKDGTFKYKSKIGDAKCNVDRVFVNMTAETLLGIVIPSEIHYIELCGVDASNTAVKERTHISLSDLA